jgi:superfamily I DNA/RNA helicase
VRRQAALRSAALRQLILLELTAEQRGAIDAPYDECFAILGAAGTGKSTALAERIARLRALEPQADPLLADRERSIDDYAAEFLRARALPVALVDDVEAEILFANACEPLFALEWDEFARNQLDPEVPGLRSPHRFLQSAFRLIRRLRDSGIGPALFLSRAMAGATEFYAKPPNFADPALLVATKSSYHDSLETTPSELARQHRREIDLAKILARLYERYVELVNTSGRMTGTDAVIAATGYLREHGTSQTSLRDRHRYAFVDDAQDLSNAQLEFLSAIFGDELAGVTLCGDPGSAISALRMTHAESTFARARAKVELHGLHRSPKVELARVSTPRDEAALIAERIGAWLGEGVFPERIAVVFRAVGSVEVYEEALLDRNIPAIVAGDVNVFADRRALDALALLWNVYDPFRHDWLLRTLASPAFGLSDASLAALCDEPPDPQRPLFALDAEPAPTARSSRWHPKRDLRLGWNVIRGERDEALGDDARGRVARFRSLRERWLRLMYEAPFSTFARTVWREGLAREGEPESARARAQQVALRRLFDRLCDFLARDAGLTLAGLLEYAQRRLDSDLVACELDARDRGFVHILSVEAARGREFDRVAIANVRPGAFPRWYSPEAFLFSPRLGMIPKENAGGSRSSRTAKFTYYMFASKAAQHYYQRERRAFAYAMRRARNEVLVTAAGTPTRGVTAPEFLEELRR